jgi:membrane-associated phospholipid phosphatase
MASWRQSELVEVLYFFYLSALTLILSDRPRADIRVFILALAVTGSIFLLALAQSRWRPVGFGIARDWWTLALVLVAYRSLDLFAPAHYSVNLEQSWLRFDVVLLETWHVRKLIESCGVLFSMYLETCYLLTSAAGCFALAILYAAEKRDRANCFLLVYVLGALLSYALIPFFPSRPPRVVFPTIAAPDIMTSIRAYNLFVLSKAGIHTGVWPSAHVSSTFSAAWGLFFCFPERKRFGWIFLVYAASVAIATVYGRYHFAVDAVAGIGVSLAALAAAQWLLRNRRLRNSSFARGIPGVSSTEH